MRTEEAFRIVPTATPFRNQNGPNHFVLADCLKPCLFSVSVTQILIRLKPKVSEIFQKNGGENEVGRTRLTSQTHDPTPLVKHQHTDFYEPSLMLGNGRFDLQMIISGSMMRFPDERSTVSFQIPVRCLLSGLLGQHCNGHKNLL